MSYLMSIDLGTSSVRAMLVESSGAVLATKGAGYDVSIPCVGYAEQDPDMWYQKTVVVIRGVLNEARIDAGDIKAVSFSGQMHGLVCVDSSLNLVCPAIIWQDQRAAQAIERMYNKLGNEYIAGQTQNQIATGFLIASLYWLANNRKEQYEKIYQVMLPKDYVKFRLSGRIVTDYSDAAGSLAFDNVKVCWAKDLIERLSLKYDIFPACRPSDEVIGNINAAAAKETGLPMSVQVVNGGSDQCMQGIGNAIIEEGIFASNIGTGGQISTIVSEPLYDKYLRTNTFAHVIPGKWNIMGACLSSGSSLKWLTNEVLGIKGFETINEGIAHILAGSEGLIFLPYLAGERTPHQDPDARGVFFGLTLKHDRFYMARAVMEGVVYSLKDCMDVILDTGIKCEKVIASGGGANSKIWLQMQADILEQDIYKSVTSEQACIGAAITAGVGCGVYKSYGEACKLLVRLDDEVYHPLPENVEKYRAYFEVFCELYQNNKDTFCRLNKLQNFSE